MRYIAGKQERDESERLSSPLSGKTPKQAAQWVQDNVNDLATAKDVLKKMAAYIVLLQNQIDIISNNDV